ncbi:Uncharacterized protein Fot_37851 [Forsythia ovata]|uniref:Uncharacterized protein n=1 Tax=Forsythia ovata TaxID=205694 RepID=A0ABD1S480_9LAMI
MEYSATFSIQKKSTVVAAFARWSGSMLKTAGIVSIGLPPRTFLMGTNSCNPLTYGTDGPSRSMDFEGLATSKGRFWPTFEEAVLCFFVLLASSSYSKTSMSSSSLRKHLEDVPSPATTEVTEVDVFSFPDWCPAFTPLAACFELTWMVQELSVGIRNSRWLVCRLKAQTSQSLLLVFVCLILLHHWWYFFCSQINLGQSV